ncbi:hypothetical protein BN136_3394 [Cronobacter universalis NCTC 9529]|nr:hypothetical protein BN136_3394 [Cronobacter universalis NCTC 9529]
MWISALRVSRRARRGQAYSSCVSPHPAYSNRLASQQRFETGQ